MLRSLFPMQVAQGPHLINCMSIFLPHWSVISQTRLGTPNSLPLIQGPVITLPSLLWTHVPIPKPLHLFRKYFVTSVLWDSNYRHINSGVYVSMLSIWLKSELWKLCLHFYEDGSRYNSKITFQVPSLVLPDRESPEILGIFLHTGLFLVETSLLL